MIYLLLLSVLLFSYWKLWQRLIRDSSGLTPTLGWVIGLVFFIIAPLSIMTVNGGFTLPAVYGVGQAWASVDLSNPEFVLPYRVVWLSLMLCCLVMYLFSTVHARAQSADTAFSIRAVKRTLWLTFVAAVCYWLFTVVVAGGVEQFLVSHWYTRGEDLAESYGDAYVLLSHLALCNQVIFTAAAALYTGMALQAGQFEWRIGFTIMIELLGETLISGNRIHIAIYLLALFTLCCLQRRIRTLIVMFALAPLLVIVFSLWASVRGNVSDLGDRTGGYFDSDRGNIIVTSLMDITEGSDTMILIHIVRDFGKDVPFLYGQSYARAFTAFIPRHLYPRKPTVFTAYLAQVYLPGEETSLNATALGEMYANFGPFSIVLMPVFTLAIVCLSNWSIRVQPAHPLRPVILFVLAINGARVTVEDSVVLFVLASLVLWIARLERTTTKLPFTRSGLVQ